MPVPPFLGAGGGVTFDLVVLLLMSVAAGFLGSLLGLGGGLILVPALFLLFHLDIRLAIAASLVSVIATSSGSAGSYVEGGLTNLRLAMFLEVATAAGGLLGALLSVSVLGSHEVVLVYAFVPIVVFSAYLMYRERRIDIVHSLPSDPLAQRLGIRGTYYDANQSRTIRYEATGTRIGLFFAGIAGIGSGLLGIGGGLFKVPAMNSFMNIPIRVAGATSNFMIGITASAGALVYLLAGDVSFGLAAPVALGVLGGSLLGPRAASRAPTAWIKTVFVGALIAAAILMLLRAIGVLA